MKSRAAAGLLVLGTGPGCGKTVVSTGLAATLQEEGFRCRAVKPVCFGTKTTSASELNFLSTISKTPLNYAVQFVEKPGALSVFGFNEALRVCNAGPAPTIVELPGCCTTPLLALSDSSLGWKDTADFASELGWPCLMVAKAGVDAVEKLLLHLSYASRLLPVVGMVTVETEPDLDRQDPAASTLSVDKLGLALNERTGVPFLGELRFSPSISVAQINQGNLIKTTSTALDLLPLIKALNLRISV